MAALSLKSMRICSGLAVLAGPLLAAEPDRANSVQSLAQNARAPIAVAFVDPVPPAPLAPAPETTWTPGPAASLSTPVPSSVSAYYGAPQGMNYYGTPGGYEARIGSPYHYYDPNGGQFVVTGDPYYDHFGPGFHRQALHGHYRFPYYNYRAPWYYPGRAVYNRDTNFAW